MTSESITAQPADVTMRMERVDTGKRRTLGHVQLRDHETKEIILIPTPSSDPNDPLNWYGIALPQHPSRELSC